MSQYEEITVKLTKRSREALEQLKEDTGHSQNNCINIGLQLYSYLQHHISAGMGLYLKDPEAEKTFEVLFAAMEDKNPS